MSASPVTADMAAYEAACGGVAVGRRPWRSVVEVGGDDREKFLQGMLSNDVSGLAAGTGCRALLLDVKGHVVADLDVFADDDKLLLGGDAGGLAAALPTLQRYVLAASVTFDDKAEEVEIIAVVGPGTEALLGDDGAAMPGEAPGNHCRASVQGVELRIVRSFSSRSGVELHVPAAHGGTVYEALRGRAGDEAPELDAVTSEVLRVEAGEPRFGAEITGAEFPQEASLDDAISYEKGCYLGQETVARIHYRGQVNRLLQGLRLTAPVAAGAELAAAGKGAGNLTSVVQSPRFGPIALGFVRRDAAEGDAELDVVQEGSVVGSAAVVALPFQD